MAEVMAVDLDGVTMTHSLQVDMVVNSRWKDVEIQCYRAEIIPSDYCHYSARLFSFRGSAEWLHHFCSAQENSGFIRASLFVAAP